MKANIGDAYGLADVLPRQVQARELPAGARADDEAVLAVAGVVVDPLEQVAETHTSRAVGAVKVEGIGAHLRTHEQDIPLRSVTACLHRDKKITHYLGFDAWDCEACGASGNVEPPDPDTCRHPSTTRVEYAGGLVCWDCDICGKEVRSNR